MKKNKKTKMEEKVLAALKKVKYGKLLKEIFKEREERQRHIGTGKQND